MASADHRDFKHSSTASLSSSPEENDLRTLGDVNCTVVDRDEVVNALGDVNCTVVDRDEVVNALGDVNCTVVVPDDIVNTLGDVHRTVDPDEPVNIIFADSTTVEGTQEQRICANEVA